MNDEREAGRDEYRELILSYTEELRKAQWAARVVAILHFLSRFVAFCNLTWATVILLGAFVSDIHRTDYFSVSFLLVLEATRLASAAFFIQLLTRFPNSGDHILNTTVHVGRIPDPKVNPEMARLLFAPFLQVLLIASSFICSIIRLVNTPVRHGSHFTDTMRISLRIFYSLVIANAIISSLALLCSFMAGICLKNPSDQSILRYYDEILQNALVNGVLKADTFNFLHFAFRMLGRDHAKFKGWAQVVKAHKKMLRYLYAHKQGADYLQVCLDSEDSWVRMAAANTVGVWAGKKGKLGLGLGLPKFRLRPELLTKLADMVAMGEVGYAVTNSFGVLAKRNPQILLQTLTSSKQPVLHRLAEIVDSSSMHSIAVVRTLVLFYNEIYQSEEGTEATGHGTGTTATAPEAKPALAASTTTEAQPASGGPSTTTTEAQTMRDEGSAPTGRRPAALPKDVEDDLVPKLKQLLEKSRVHRLRIQSAYLLYLLGQLDTRCHDLISDINPSADWYWYAMEKTMLEFFISPLGPSPTYPDIYPDEEDILPPPWNPDSSSTRHTNGDEIKGVLHNF